MSSNEKRLFFATLLLVSLTAAGGAYAEATKGRELDSLFTAAMRMTGRQSSGVSSPSARLRPVKCGLSLMNQIRSRFSQFSPQQRILLSQLFFRPVLPLYAISADGRFRIHYTLTGSDAVSGADADGNGVPDYIDAAANSLEYVYHIEVEELGFKPPPADDTDGPEWDIYIQNITDSYGSTMPDRQISDDPYNAFTSYIQLDNGYESTDTKGLNGLRITIAHEFFHMIQLGYNAREDTNGNFTDLFLWEAASTWMEDVVYNGINDYYYYLGDFFRTTNRRFDTADGWREYGLSLWFHFLEKRLGTRSFALAIWNQLYQAEAVEANDRALREFGTTFSDELGLFYAWNYMTGSRADTVHYYPEGNAYPEITLDGTYSLDEQRDLDTEVTTTGSRYYAFTDPSGDRYTFVLTDVRRTVPDAFDPISMSLAGTHQESSIRIDDFLYARVTRESEKDWRNTVFIEKTGTGISMKALDDSTSFFDAVKLPACIPNPLDFSKGNSVQIPFQLESKALVHLLIFTVSGYKVYESAEFKNVPGLTKMIWKGTDDNGRAVPGGIYPYAVVADGKVVRRDKIAVVR
jgi:hypothetical protein